MDRIRRMSFVSEHAENFPVGRVGQIRSPSKIYSDELNIGAADPSITYIFLQE